MLGTNFSLRIFMVHIPACTIYIVDALNTIRLRFTLGENLEVNINTTHEKKRKYLKAMFKISFLNETL